MKSLPELEALLAAARAATVDAINEASREHDGIIYLHGKKRVGVEAERLHVFKAAFDPTTAVELMEELIALRKRCEQWEEWRLCHGPMPSREEAGRA